MAGFTIKIVSDGTVAGGGTRVVDDEGREVPGIQSITWSIDCDKQQLAIARATFAVPAIEARAELRLDLRQLTQLARAHGFKLVPL